MQYKQKATSVFSETQMKLWGHCTPTEHLSVFKELPD